MAENWPNLEKEIDIQIQKARKLPSKSNTRNLHWHIIIKLSKVQDKEKIIKAKEMQLVMYKGNLIR